MQKDTPNTSSPNIINSSNSLKPYTANIDQLNLEQMKFELQQKKEKYDKLRKNVERHSSEIREYSIKNEEMEKTIHSMISTHQVELQYLHHCKSVYPFFVTKRRMNQLLVQILKDCFIYNNFHSKLTTKIEHEEDSGEEEEAEFEFLSAQFSLWNDMLSKSIDIEVKEKRMGGTDKMIKYTIDLKYLKPKGGYLKDTGYYAISSQCSTDDISSSQMDKGASSSISVSDASVRSGKSGMNKSLTKTRKKVRIKQKRFRTNIVKQLKE